MFYKETNFKETPIGKIPKEWNVTKLESIAKTSSGNTAPQDEKYFMNGKYPFIRVQHLTDLQEQKYPVNCDYINDYAISDLRLKKFKKGSIIFPKSGESIKLEKRAILKEDSYVVNHLAVIEPFDKNTDILFLFYYLCTVKTSNYLTKTTMPSLNLSTISDFLIPLPPLQEQQKIAEILSTVDEAIQKKNEIIAKTERLKKGLMQELLMKGIGHEEFKDTEIGRIPKEWGIVTLNDITKQFISGGTPSTKNPNYWNGDIPWIRSVHLMRYYIDETSIEQYITKEGLENSASNIVPKGNVIIATRVGIGKAAVNLIDVAINQDLTGLVIDKSKIDPFFLVWYLLSPKILTLLESFTRGTTIKGIARNYVKNLLIPLPPINEQRRISEILSTVDKKLEVERNEKAKLEKIKQGLMDLLLTGKIRVR